MKNRYLDIALSRYVVDCLEHVRSEIEVIMYDDDSLTPGLSKAWDIISSEIAGHNKFQEDVMKDEKNEI